MKLLNCIKCHDIVALGRTARTCLCGTSKGRYLADGLYVAIIGEHARVMGMLNPEYKTSLVKPTIPWKTHYKWFPILPLKEHHVLVAKTEEEFTKL